MIAQHDPGQVIRVRAQHAFVEQGPDGQWLLKMHAEVHRDDWDEWDSVIKAAGAPGGMSLGLTEPVRIPQEPAGIEVAGDAVDFGDAELLEIAQKAPENIPIAVVRLYRFTAHPEPVTLVLAFTARVLQAVPANLLADWLTRAIDRLRTRASSTGRRPVFEV